MTVYVAAVGDSNDPQVWSGTPYFMLEAMQEAGADALGMPLKSLRHHAMSAALWSAFELLRGRGIGGYQYSQPFQRTLWAGKRDRLKAGDTVLSLFQMLPDQVVALNAVRKVFYIDQTLRQLFESYAEASHVSDVHRRMFVAREREQYLAADLVIGHCRWCIDDVVARYDVPVERTAVVLPGANLGMSDYARWRSTATFNAAGADRPLRLVFIGKDFRRKGLLKLIAAIDKCKRQDRIELAIIGPQGPEPEFYPRPYVKFLGRIDKTSSSDRFAAEVSCGDVGVLLSSAEAGGISIREFHAYGLAVIASAVGGSPEMAHEGASIVLRPDIDVAALATLLDELVRDPDRVNRMKAAAWQARDAFLWSKAAMSICERLACL